MAFSCPWQFLCLQAVRNADIPLSGLSEPAKRKERNAKRRETTDYRTSGQKKDSRGNSKDSKTAQSRQKESRIRILRTKY